MSVTTQTAMQPKPAHLPVQTVPTVKNRRYIAIDSNYRRSTTSFNKKQIVVDVPIPHKSAQQVNITNTLGGVPAVRITRIVQNTQTCPPKVVPIDEALKAMEAESAPVTAGAMTTPPHQRNFVILQFKPNKQSPQIVDSGENVTENYGGPVRKSLKHVRFAPVVAKQVKPVLLPQEVHYEHAEKQSKLSLFTKVSQSFSLGPQAPTHVASALKTINGPVATRPLAVSCQKSSVTAGPSSVPRVPREMANALQRTFAPDYGRPKACPVSDLDPSYVALQLARFIDESEYASL
ncbi:uncharacterized protein LOC111260743 [Varroa jacobsoni]|uniref:uncharacterized protein LOC111260743 n=1 Tax=Varroa jacobsoni TaxID=62625 RepID=UPI000BF46AD1|nr:uncharacterized protein LOC111260743 [Varroa jacobsoni]XP_022689449.1 uncharacterized protein LOC111260743 [Varroa jacobsoni]